MENNESKFLSLNRKDWIKGFITAVLMSLITGVYASISEGAFPPDAAAWKAMGITGLGAGLAYILKNALSNSDDQFLKKEKKEEFNNSNPL